MSFPEIGYTPKNLHHLKDNYKLSSPQIAEILGLKSVRSVEQWLASRSVSNHADMPYKKWKILLDYCIANEKELKK